MVKNSETEISRCRDPNSAADTAAFGSEVWLSAAAPLDFSIGLDISFSHLRILYKDRFKPFKRFK